MKLNRDVIFRFSLNLDKYEERVSVSVRVADTLTRSLYVTLIKDGIVYDLNDVEMVIIKCLKPDGNLVYNDCVISGNEIKYSVTTQTVNIKGDVRAEFVITGKDGSVITSPQFVIHVYEQIYDDAAVESFNEYNGLVTCLTNAKQAEATATASVNQCVLAANEASENANSAHAASTSAILASNTTITLHGEVVSMHSDIESIHNGAVSEFAELVIGAESSLDLAKITDIAEMEMAKNAYIAELETIVPVTGIKGISEATYRVGLVEITPANIGLSNVEDKNSETIRGELTAANITGALGYTPPTQDTTYALATQSTAGLLSPTDKVKIDNIAGVTVNNTVTSTSTTEALSANQGRLLAIRITALEAAILELHYPK